MLGRWLRGSVVRQLTLIPVEAHNRQCLATSNPKTARSDECTNAGISLENRHFSPLLGSLGAPSRWQSSLSMSLQQQEIGPEARPHRQPRNRVAAASQTAISNSA